MDKIIIVENNPYFLIATKYFEDLGYEFNIYGNCDDFSKESTSLFIKDNIVEWCVDCRKCGNAEECYVPKNRKITTIHNLLRSEKLKRILYD
jgi:hypothetical protein